MLRFEEGWDVMSPTRRFKHAVSAVHQAVLTRRHDRLVVVGGRVQVPQAARHLGHVATSAVLLHAHNGRQAEHYGRRNTCLPRCLA